MTTSVRALEERTLLRGILERACLQHQEAVGAVVGACGDLLAAAGDLVNKGPAQVVVADGIDTFAARLDALWATVAVLNDRHGLVAVLSELLARFPGVEPSAGGAAC
jgi:hypothetical protein